jgi:hypothetical protein
MRASAGRPSSRQKQRTIVPKKLSSVRICRRWRLWASAVSRSRTNWRGEVAALEPTRELVALVVGVGRLGEGAEDAVADLAGGRAREGAGEDRVRRGAAAEDLQVAVGELVGLARAGRGEDADVLQRDDGRALEAPVRRDSQRGGRDVLGLAQEREHVGARAVRRG